MSGKVSPSTSYFGHFGHQSAKKHFRGLLQKTTTKNIATNTEFLWKWSPFWSPFFDCFCIFVSCSLSLFLLCSFLSLPLPPMSLQTHCAHTVHTLHKHTVHRPPLNPTGGGPKGEILQSICKFMFLRKKSKQSHEKNQGRSEKAPKRTKVGKIN